MTVTVLPTRPLAPRHAPSYRRRPGTVSVEEPTPTVSFVVTLTGEDRFLEAAGVLDTLRQVTSRLTGAAVNVSPALALAPPPASTVEHEAIVGSAAVVESAAADEEEQALILVETREVRHGGRSIPFTRIEFDLLRFLAEHPRQVFTREQLLRHVWGFAHGGHRTVDVHIRRLRAKLGDREVATTVRGVGYRLADGANLRVVRLAYTPVP